MAGLNLIQQLHKILPENRVLDTNQLSERYSHIWHMDQSLIALGVVLPETTEEVSQILKACHTSGTQIIVHGGLTNLVGGTETNADQLVISLERMNQIEEIDENSRTATVQSGVILESLHTALEEKNLLFPLNFGARGSAQIGGIISSNAGGLRVLKYGMTRKLILGLEAVMADGTIISSTKKIIKDNSGYDLKQLFIGSEGTLGIVTRAVLKLEEAPSSRNAAYLAVDDYQSVVRLLKFFDQGLAGKLSGFELIWCNSYEQMTSTSDAVRPPLPYGYNYYILVESLGSQIEQDQTEFQNLLEQVIEKEMALDAVMAQSPSDVEWFFRIREDVNNLTDSMTHDQHFDISLPVALIGDYIEECYQKLKNIAGIEQVYAFGHVADGNIHFMIGKEHLKDDLRLKINDIIYTGLKEIGGSVSAEHGIGLHKKDYLNISRSESEIALMKTLKASLDPKGILNPGRILA
ncbi:FAD/FMN-containing dehydrogenase [Nonlabens sp. Hel1_33_55]|uniref:FAD-binding oxidoreductase n=1 Tax=Nonlabens sp. Hel1_33_55 TaxID=1336802 RepID=UPI000875B600|nr:FAD-binding oxidoreductase [Nonlabens sp. Hel1_33_55]SCY20695.1 FAD/FMN-containing dehydrogenase [Nonlabens sp. Hel1_33_55]